MIRTIIWFVYFWLYLIFVLPTLINVKKLDRQNKIKERDDLVFKTVQSWARSLVRLSGAKIKVIGEENIPKNQAVVFVSNHQGNFDIPILLGFLNKPKAFIAKKEILKIPMISTWMKYMNCIFMDRSDIRQSLKAINQGVEYIKDGYSMVIFPEGTRSVDGQLGDFKPGSLKLASKSGALIIPITVKGSNQIMSKNSLIIKPHCGRGSGDHQTNGKAFYARMQYYSRLFIFKTRSHQSGHGRNRGFICVNNPL